MSEIEELGKAEGMNARERFLAVMDFQEVDRIPIWILEDITEQAIRRWCGQGLPLGADAEQHAGFDPKITISLSTAPIPNFVARVVDSDDESVTTVDRYGFTVRTLRENAVSPLTYYYLKGTVESRGDWLAVKKRYEADDTRRYGECWSEPLVRYYNDATCPVTLTLPWGPGRGIKNGYMLGLESFLDKVVHEPAMLEEMFEFWGEFLIGLVTPLLDQVTVDLLFLDEDGIAYKNSSLISPETYRRIWAPHMRRFVEYVRDKGVRHVGHYTAGNATPLIPVLLDIGVNLFAPLEVAAGMDARCLRKEYGSNILLMGNFARQALMDGPDAINDELDAKIPALMRQGGFIPAVDDQILPDISYTSYMHYLTRMKNWRAPS